MRFGFDLGSLVVFLVMCTPVIAETVRRTRR